MRKEGAMVLVLLLFAVTAAEPARAAERGVQLVEAANGTWEARCSAMPGEPVHCRSVFPLEGGREYIVRSAFSPGVSFLELEALRWEGRDVNASAYTLLTGRYIEPGAFDLRLSALATERNGTLEIEYSVFLTENAPERSACGLEVSEMEKIPAAAVITSCGFDLYRGVAVQGAEKQSNPLPGTCYCLYRDRELRERVAFIAGENGKFTVCAADCCVHTRHAYLLRTGENGTLHIQGLSQGRYYLLESRTPEGHGSLADGTEITVGEEGEIVAGGVPLTDGRLALVERLAGNEEKEAEKDPLAFYVYGSRVLSVLLTAMVAGRKYLFR